MSTIDIVQTTVLIGITIAVSVLAIGSFGGK
jgi:hypothetical protein